MSGKKNIFLQRLNSATKLARVGQNWGNTCTQYILQAFGFTRCMFCFIHEYCHNSHKNFRKWQGKREKNGHNMASFEPYDAETLTT